MAKQNRIKLDPAKLLGLKHLADAPEKKTLIAQAMAGYGKIGYSKPPPVAAL